MPKMNTQVEKPVSRQLGRQVRSIVNQLLTEANCAGCGERHSIHEMDADVETGASYCEKCRPALIGAQSAA